jgi:Spy/CpxP family protein refolding chaperone
MKKISVTLLTVIFFAVLATSALAAPWGRGMGRGPTCDGDGTRYLKHLNLTADQTASIKTLRDAHLKDVKPLHDKMFAKRGDLRLLWLEKNPNQDKIVALQKEIRTIRDQMQDKATDLHFAITNVLTPEQKEKLQTTFRGRGHGHGPGFGPMGGPGGPCGMGFGDRSGKGMRGNW